MTKARDLANGGFGLVLVKPSTVVGGTDNGKGTVSFSAASSVSLNDVFSSTYNHYRIVSDIQTSAANPELDFRYRVSGSDNSTSNYYFTGFYSFSSDTIIGNDNLYRGDPTTSWAVGIGGNNQTSLMMDLVSPYLSAYKAFSSQSGCMVNTNEAYSLTMHGGFSGTTSFTGFTIFPASGTMSGNVSVYGYNK